MSHPAGTPRPEDRRDDRPAPPAERIRVDLGRLPGWLQLLIAVTVAAAVGALALLVGPPAGGGSLLVGVVVGLLALALVAYAVARRR